MKQYDRSTYRFYLKEATRLAKDATPRDIEFYMPWVIDIANGFNRSETNVGTLDLNDLVSSGNEGLVRAWNNMDWNKADAIQGEQGYMWNYISTKVKSYIMREIENNGSFIKVPRRDIESQRVDLTGIEKIYVELFPKFFDADFPEYVEEMTMWDNELLYEFLMDLLEKHVPNSSHRTMLTLTYGIDTMDDKPVSAKKIGEMYSKSSGYVSLVVHRVLKNLRENEEVQEKIKIYLEN